MADNPSIDPGTTPSIPVEGDDIGGGVIAQAVIVRWGAKDASVRAAVATPLPVVQTGTPALPTGASTETTLAAQSALYGPVNETAPTTDTASSGLNGRLQRIAQRLTSLIALLPGSLGQKTMANGFAVTIASDQSAVNVADGGGSFTVDAPVGTPVFTRLSDGTAALTTSGGRLAVDASGVAVPITDNAGSLTVDNGGTFAVQSVETRATTGAAPVAFTATTSTQVFASNAARKLFTVYNNSNVDLYLMLASAPVSVTSYHVKVPANGGYFATSDYSGEIRGILSAAIATGQVNPGEFT